jgi:Ca2+-transporting ATPase
VDWVEGVAILTAILIVVGVGSLDDWQKERQFQVLNVKKEDCHVKVICDGGERQIDVHQVVVHCSSLAKLFLAMVSSFLVTTCCATSPTRRESRMRSRSFPTKNASLSETSSSWNWTLTDPLVTASCLVDLTALLLTEVRFLKGLSSYVVIAVGTKSFGWFIALPIIWAL